MKVSEKIIIYVTVLSVGAFWVSALTEMAIASLPCGALRQSRVEAFNLRYMMPQGWGFFTRNPREDNYFVYRIHENGEIYPILTKSNSLGNLFGIKRNSRIQSMEMGAMIQRLKAYSWLDCASGNNACLAEIKEMCATPVLNVSPAPTICGELIITLKEVVPWAWGHSYKNIDMPAKTIKINAICHQPTAP